MGGPTSRLAQPNGDDYPDAAVKHLADARILLRSMRHDGAAYHASYVVECVAKTIVQLERGHAWGHLGDVGRVALCLAGLPASRAARYVSGPSLAPKVEAGWTSGMRYRPEGRIAAIDAGCWVAEAERLVAQSVDRMRLDGLI